MKKPEQTKQEDRAVKGILRETVEYIPFKCTVKVPKDPTPEQVVALITEAYKKWERENKAKADFEIA